MSLKFFDIIVIGGGAAGLMCALTAGQRKRRVLVLEGSNKVGKKILLSGGGRCNFTNLHITPERFLSENPHFCKSALARYTQWDFIELVKKHGIAYHEKTHGQLFCNASSKDILTMLLDECRRGQVQIITNAEISQIKPEQRFQLLSNHGEFACESLVVATGGLSFPTLGATGFGYEIAQQFDLKLLPRRAGLVPLTFSDPYKSIFSRLSGQSLKVKAHTAAQTFHENILFTHRGLSGPAILQLSNYWEPGQVVELDLLPDVDVFTWLKACKQTQPKALLRTVLTQRLPRKLVLELEACCWPQHAELEIAQWSDTQLKAIAQQLHGWQLKPVGTEGYRTAEVTLGGVATEELSSKTMQTIKQPGLFFIGEVMDVTGHLGGFNFQWAWSSGYAAGLAA